MFSSNTSAVSNDVNYIEDVFSTWLYTGNGSTQTITNGVDLSGKGGMVWVKRRNSPANDHAVMDTARGIATNGAWTLLPNDTFAQFDNNTVTAFNSNGFTLGSSSFGNSGGGFNYASWTFREQAKFFDVVTYTGNGSNRTIAHNLGSVPGCIMVKRTDTTGAWAVYHRSLANTEYLILNTTAAKATGATYWNSTTATSTDFSLGTATDVNASGGTYVAYLFAHDAGGFGLTGTDNVISCGAFTADGSGNATITGLGYEPQWVLIKSTDFTDGWYMLDNMRGWSLSSTNYLLANTSGAETAGSSFSNPTADGFVFNYGTGANNKTFIYIAIRRGPMRTPTTGTSVFSPNAYSTTGAAGNPQTTGFPVDWMIQGNRSGGSVWPAGFSRLQGGSQYLQTSSNAAEATQSGGAINFDSNTNFSFVAQWFNNGAPSVSWSLRRAPGFFDVVCYRGNGSSPRAISHNLAVAPELIFSKSRSTAAGWIVYAAPAGFSVGGVLNSATAFSSGVASVTATSASTYTTWENDSGVNFVAYLFASCPGVSKVGSYTGNGSSQTINCGFTSGARFVMIKRTDSTGDWYVWDTARGIISGNDPYLLLNSTAAEATTTDYLSVQSSGFGLTASAPAALNASGGTYIFLAIA